MKLRKGFTLVELLIVIIIIGILAAAMLLSSGSATDAAEASNVISDLRSLKSAALLLYVDSHETIGDEDLTITLLAPYVDNPQKFANDAGYMFTRDTGKWWVGYNMSNGKSPKTAGVRAKVAGRAAEVGLFVNHAANPTSGTKYGGEQNVWMVAR